MLRVEEGDGGCVTEEEGKAVRKDVLVVGKVSCGVQVVAVSINNGGAIILTPPRPRIPEVWWGRCLSGWVEPYLTLGP